MVEYKIVFQPLVPSSTKLDDHSKPKELSEFFTDKQKPPSVANALLSVSVRVRIFSFGILDCNAYLSCKE